MHRQHFARAAGLLLLLGLAALSLLSLPAGAARRRAAPYVEGQALVCFRPDVPEADVLAVLQRHGATVLGRFSATHLYCVRLPRNRPTRAGILRLGREQSVVFCQPNYLYHAHQLLPNDPFFPYLWNLNNTGQEEGAPDADIDAPEAWELTQGSSEVVVAVIDTGIDAGHPDLAPNLWTNPGEIPGNGRDDDGNRYIDDVHGWDALENDGDPQDANGHGTHVAGTIGAVGGNGIGITGVAWRVRIVALRFLDADGAGTTADAIECLDYVNRLRDRGVNVVATNNSWGGLAEFDRALYDAIARANQRGILFVAAAGNEGRSVQEIPDYPGGFDLPNIVTVAATDRSDRLAAFSNYGATQVDLAAPGVEILSTVPRLIDPELPYRFLSGTSMAAPHVTGALALLKAHLPALSAAELRNRILATGDPLPDLQGTTLTGRRLNVHRALDGEAPPPPGGPELRVQIRVERTARIGGSVALRVAVSDPLTGAPAPQAIVRLTILTASGNLYAAEGATGSTGIAAFRFRPTRADGRGLYVATAETERAGYSRGCDTETFRIR